MSNTPIGRNYVRHSESTWNEKGGESPPNHVAVLSLSAPEARRGVLDRSEDRELDDAVLADRPAGRPGEEVIDIVSVRITNVKARGRQINEITAKHTSRSKIDELITIDEQVLDIEPITIGISCDRERQPSQRNVLRTSTDRHAKSQDATTKHHA